ncbi:MAG: DUF4388 domain-containing protein [Deltaproteobacteria bacterium]|nr:DUF4388 domain-containing protein [Deltaproteobacteria bacterium]
MRIPWCRAIQIGKLSAWGEQFLTSLQENSILDVSHLAGLEELPAPDTSTVPQLLVIENFPESRQWILKLRQGNHPFYILWFGRNFSKEDIIFALTYRVYCTLENPKSDDKNVHMWIKKASQTIENSKQFSHLISTLRTLFKQIEGELALSYQTELKTAISKIEHYGMHDELAGISSDQRGPRENIAFNRSETFAEMLNSMHDLERTGVLWVKGDGKTEEGRVEFLQGRIVLAAAGETHGLKALFRIFLWDNPRFLFTHRGPDECLVTDHLNIVLKYLCLEGEELKRHYDKCRAHIPPSDLVLELEPSALHIGTRLATNDFLTLASVVEYGKVSDILDYNPLPDALIYKSLISLRQANLIRL